MGNNRSGKLLLILIILGFVAGLGFFVFKSYKGLETKIAKEITEIEPFNKENVSAKIAKEMNVSLPIKETPLSKKTIKRNIKKELKAILKKSLILSKYSKEIQGITKKYRLAKHGDKVSFLLNTTGKRIFGKYKGLVKDWKGVIVLIDYDKYRMYDIGEESRYLFNSVIAQKRASEEIETIKEKFKKNKKSLIEAVINNVTESHYNKGGYSKNNGKWKENIIAFNDSLEKKEKEYKADKEKKIKMIYEENKLFGLLMIDSKKEGIPYIN